MKATVYGNPRVFPPVSLLGHIPFLAFVLCGLSGCLGAGALTVSRASYNNAVQSTNNEEFLRNLVRLRYSEEPQWLRLTSVNVQYEANTTGLTTGAAGGVVSKVGFGSLFFADRPTLTFDPTRSSAFTKALVTRLDSHAFLTLDAVGWDVNRMLRIFIEEINGIPNASNAGRPTPRDAPEYLDFKNIAAVTQKLSNDRLISFRIDTKQQDVEGTTPMKIEGDAISSLLVAGFGLKEIHEKYQPTKSESNPIITVAKQAKETPEWQFLEKQLRLKSETDQYELEFKPTNQTVPHHQEVQLDELTFTTRSIFEAMYYLSHAIEVPVEHQMQGVARVTCNPDGTPFNWCDVTGDLLMVRVSKRRPKCAYTSVKHRGYWFYIADCDIDSKTTIALMQEVIRLQRLDSNERPPLLTLPIGGR